MKIPKKLKVGGFDYDIIFDDKFVEKETLCGQHQPNRLKIILQTGVYNQQKIDQTFWHEVAHAISCVYLGENEMTEDQIDNFSQGLYQVLKDNKFLKE